MRKTARPVVWEGGGAQSPPLDPIAVTFLLSLLRWLYLKIMRIQIQLLRLFAFLVCIAGSSHAQDDGLNWLGDYREAILQAKQTHKPIFVEFRCEA